MGQIQVLSVDLINRIAAGECVERAASVVKELIENALDAGAARIDVTIADGGRELIRVSDDGMGMDAGDLRLAIHPHATSKIRVDDDLFAIHTMGFRGEALASIGAVSRMTVTSRRRGDEVGHTLRVEGGAVDEPAPCAAPFGTTVEVRDLFYSVPARRRFMKTNQTEMGHISEQFARIALAYPEVAFSLRREERVFYKLASASRPQRIADVLGPELAATLLTVDRESHGLRVSGCIAPPSESRGSNKWEYIFVNGRHIRDRFVSHAIKEAYRSLVEPGRYPVAFLFLTIDPQDVDVNVHPTKSEVRWRDSNFVHGQVLAALRDRLLTTNLDHGLRAAAPVPDVRREAVRQAMVDFFTGPSARAAPPPPRPQPAIRSEPSYPEARIAPAATVHRPAAPQAEPAPSEAPAPTPVAEVRKAIQLHNMYIVAETADGLMIIDQHALHERVLFEQFSRRVAARPLESQRLLIPEVVRVRPEQLESLEAHADLLARVGVELAPAGPQSVALHGFPSLLERVDRTPFVRDLLDILAQKGARPSPETLIHEVLDMMACKAAVKFGDPLTADEIASLLSQREAAERSSHCPHGRPTTLQLSLRDLERQFKRR